MTKLIEIISSLHNVWPTTPHSQIEYITQDNDGLIAYWGCFDELPNYVIKDGEWFGSDCVDTRSCFDIADDYSEAIITEEEFIQFKECKLAVTEEQIASSTLKYKVGDEVVLGSNVDSSATRGIFAGAIVKITDVHEQSENPHYTVQSGNKLPWWVEDSEINHEVTKVFNTHKEAQKEATQTSNENPHILSFLSRITVVTPTPVGVVGGAQEEPRHTHISLDKDSLTGNSLIVVEQGVEYTDSVVHFSIEEAEAVIKAMQTLMRK